jgi:hypothetical protein
VIKRSMICLGGQSCAEFPSQRRMCLKKKSSRDVPGSLQIDRAWCGHTHAGVRLNRPEPHSFPHTLHSPTTRFCLPEYCY